MTVVKAFPLVLSEDAGDYYCAHLNFLCRLFAEREETTILKNANDEALQCFLHVPGQNFDLIHKNSRKNYDGIKRLHQTISQVAGHYIELGARRIVITGYEAFMDVKWNPCAAYTDMLAEMDLIFTNKTLEVLPLSLAVDDRILKPSHSLWSMLMNFRPHAIISLGVCRGFNMVQVEVHADDRGLDMRQQRHVSNRQATRSLRRNFSGLCK